MSLDWSVGKVKDFETVCKMVATADAPTMGISKGDLMWKPLTIAMSHLTMIVGIGRLTDKMAPEFYARVKFVEGLYGCFWYDGTGTPQEITWENVLAYVGLSSNVVNESRAKFVKRHVDSTFADSIRFYHVQVARQAAEEAWEQNTHDLNV